MLIYGIQCFLGAVQYTEPKFVYAKRENATKCLKTRRVTVVFVNKKLEMSPLQQHNHKGKCQWLL